MLYEITRVQQVPGEPRRRWFFSHEQDLLMWFGDNGTPVAFQLAYSKYRNEHAIRWKVGSGFTHYSVDDGEAGAVTSDTPILLPGGFFPVSEVLTRFIELSDEVPREVVAFVTARLREHPDYREATPWSHRPGIASGLAIGLAIVSIGLLLARSLRQRH